jgi:hypothetical protein
VHTMFSKMVSVFNQGEDAIDTEERSPDLKGRCGHRGHRSQPVGNEELVREVHRRVTQSESCSRQDLTKLRVWMTAQKAALLKNRRFWRNTKRRWRRYI